MTEPNRVRVLGLGNTLAGDDGVGPRVIELLQRGYEFSSGVELLDVGTPGLDLIEHLVEADAVLLVDAVRGSGRGARVRVYRGEAALACLPLERSGAHEPPLRRSLAVLRLAGRGPRELVLVGIAPCQWRLGAGLSPPVRRAVARAASAVRRELARLGVRSHTLGGDRKAHREVPAAAHPFCGRI